MIKQIRKILVYMISILFTSICGVCHLVILSSLGLIGVITGILTILMPIFGLLCAFGMENIFIMWNDVRVPRILGLPTGIFLGMILAGITWVCFRAFLGYFSRISNDNI